MPKILLTADRSLMGSDRGEGIDYTITAGPSLVPKWFFQFLFFPDEKLRYLRQPFQKEPAEAPYGLRKIEAQLLREDMEVLVVDPEHLDMISGFDVLGIYVMDPFGIGLLPATCQQISKVEESTLTRPFITLLENPDINSAKKRGLKIFVGGPGAWQLKFKGTQDEYGIDCVISGEAEKIIGDFIRKALRGENLPRFHEVAIGENPTIEEIPDIQKPSSNGLIEIGRGCPKGCSFCSVAEKPLRWYPLDKIERELRVNNEAGLRSCVLQAEDVLLYGSNTLTPNSEKVLALHKLAKKYASTITWTSISIESVAQDAKLIENLSRLILGDSQSWWGTNISIETGSPRLLSSMFSGKIKPFKPRNWPKVVQEAARIMAENKLFPTYDLVVNLPGETEQDVKTTLRLVRNLEDCPSLIVPLIFTLPSSILKGPSRFKKIEPMQQELLINCYKHDLKWSKNLLDLYFKDKMIEWFFKDAFQMYLPPDQITTLDRPLKKLKQLLEEKVEQESVYHNFFKKYPWILGAQFASIEDHRKLNDENIPDFTAVRARDGFNDIVEIKQPFAGVFRQDGNFSSNFNDAWNQLERYLNFAREEKDYLRRKGLSFENPRCYLIIGYNIDSDGMKKIRRKESLNPSMEIITYNDLLVQAEKTTELVGKLKFLT